MITVKEAYEKYYKAKFENGMSLQAPDDPYRAYLTIVSFMKIPPQFDGSMDRRQFPKYAKWYIGRVLKIEHIGTPKAFEDLYKLYNLCILTDGTHCGYLDIFDMLKRRRMISGREADINTYPTIQALGEFLSKWDLNEVMENNSDNTLRKRINEKGKDEIDVVYEDDKWKTLIPKTYEASCYWGTDTHWCTATRSDRYMYDRYTKEGPLYININKLTGRKYQFHFPSKQFMDEKDCRLDSYTYKTIMKSCNYLNCVFKGNARIYSHILSKSFDMYDGSKYICLYGDGSNELEIWDFNTGTMVFYSENVANYKVIAEGETKYVSFYDGDEYRRRVYLLETQEYLYDNPTRYRFLDGPFNLFVYDYVDSVIIDGKNGATYKVNYPVETIDATMGGMMYCIGTDKQFYHLDGRPIFPNMKYSAEKKYRYTFVTINERTFEVMFGPNFELVEFMSCRGGLKILVNMENGQMTLNEDEVIELYQAKLNK